MLTNNAGRWLVAWLGLLLLPLTTQAEGLVWYRVSSSAPAASVPQPPEIIPAATLPATRVPVATHTLASMARQARLADYLPLILEVSERYQVDPLLLRAVIQVESAWQPSAISPKGAIGLMQVMPATGLRFGKSTLQDPRNNVEAGAAYLQWLIQRFNGRIELALAGYNAGEGKVDRHGQAIPPYPETQQYVKKVLANYAALKGQNTGQRNAIVESASGLRTASRWPRHKSGLPENRQQDSTQPDPQWENLKKVWTIFISSPSRNETTERGI